MATSADLLFRRTDEITVHRGSDLLREGCVGATLEPSRPAPSPATV